MRKTDFDGIELFIRSTHTKRFAFIRWLMSISINKHKGRKDTFDIRTMKMHFIDKWQQKPQEIPVVKTKARLN